MTLVPAKENPTNARAAAKGLRLEPWSAANLPLLRRLNVPKMTEHLGGPESEQKLLERQKKYVNRGPAGGMFTVVLLDNELAVGSIGYWEREWGGETVFETGWGVLPEFQGRGIAVDATRAVIQLAAAEQRHRHLHAYPSVDNPASNAICRKVGFDLLGECDFEYPPGHPLRCNDWRFDLRSILLE
jgi:Acetyltransferases, including N-acetylases of ribosomal proteins